MNKFSKKDLESIIRLASEFDEIERKKHDEQSFLIKDITEIAQNCGISDESLKKALIYFTNQKTSFKASINTNKYFVSTERISSTQMNETSWEKILDFLRGKYKSHGFFTQLNDVYEWSSNFRKKDNIHVRFTNSDQYSIIKIKLEKSAFTLRLKSICSILGFILFAIISSYLDLDSISTNFMVGVNFTGAILGFFVSSPLLNALFKRKLKKQNDVIIQLQTIIENEIDDTFTQNDIESVFATKKSKIIID